MSDHDLNEGDVYDIVLTNGEELSGYTLYVICGKTMLAKQIPTLAGTIGLKRVVNLKDVEEIYPV